MVTSVMFCMHIHCLFTFQHSVPCILMGTPFSIYKMIHQPNLTAMHTPIFDILVDRDARRDPPRFVVKVNQLSYNLSGSALVQFELNFCFGGLMRDARLHPYLWTSHQGNKVKISVHLE